MKPGPLFEAQLTAYAREHGFEHARRLVMGGSNDIGDIILGDNILWVIEAKNEKVRDVPGALREARKEAETASRMHGGLFRYAAIHKYRNHSIAESIVSIPYWLFLEMLMEER